jgi:hypothetical protein
VSTATRSLCRQTTARSPYEHGEVQAPGAGVKASPGSASPDPAAERGDVVSFSPRSPTMGFLSDCHTGALVPLESVQI